MKGIRRFRKKRSLDGNTFRYYDIAKKKEMKISREELYSPANTLPIRCKSIISKVTLFKVPMTEQEQKDMTLLCQLSIYCWKGSPRCDMPGISMEDYTTDFYIEMCGCLHSWNPEKGPWVAYVKWVRLKTLKNTFRRWEILKRGMEVKNFHAIDKENVAYKAYDEDFALLGTSVSEGRRVKNLNRA